MVALPRGSGAEIYGDPSSGDSMLLGFRGSYRRGTTAFQRRSLHMAMLQPMDTFDPTKRCTVHDRVNEILIPWNPESSSHYRTNAFVHEPGVIGWDGLLLDGWTELVE